MRRSFFGLTFAVILAAWCVLSASAHQTTESYLSLSLETNLFKGRWAIALRDLDHVLTIDADKDGEVSDAELKLARAPIEKYAFERIEFALNGLNQTPKVTAFETEEHDSAVFATLLFDLPVRGSDLLITYRLFFETDPLHRGLFRLDLPERTETMIFSPAQPTQRFALEGPETPHPANFVREGVWHIWIGFDHILFLVALLLPSVLTREKSLWTPSASWRASLANIVKIVTAFTVAHSITLTLATLEVVRLSPRLVESVIAASVLLAALNNLRPIFPERIWVVAFGFGLIHGFGFANVLSELALPRQQLGYALLGFNVGVELGQLAIVLVFVPIAFSLRKTRAYQRFILPGGSVTIAALAAIWMLERIIDKKFLPF